MSPSSAGIRAVPVVVEHRQDWEKLYAGYAAFYQVVQTPEMRATVWGWILDPSHEVEGLIAVDPSGRAVGLAHFRPFARPLAASVGGFLDDLFVAPQARGSGAAQALIEAGFTPEEARRVVPKKGKGCERCNHTGYKGRIGLYEVMEVTDELRELILVGASALELRRKAIDDGMVTLRRSGLQKVMDGVTTIEEVARETVK